jgi:hypothetical protein
MSEAPDFGDSAADSGCRFGRARAALVESNRHDALISGNHHLVVYVFDRFGSVSERRRPNGPERTSGQDRITGTLQITRMFERKSCIIKCSVT